MNILDNLIIISLIVASFCSGMYVANKYNRKIQAQNDYANKILSAQGGLGYIAPPQTERKKVPIGQPFMDKLSEQGRAVQALNTSRGFRR